jgi:lipoate-protein ligase A
VQTWRVIFDGKGTASANMAADAYLLEMAETGESAPVIRLYEWERPSITIGYHQRLERAADVRRLGDTPVVRRPTGGRALYHDNGEITYAVAGNFVRYPILGDTLRKSYRIIAEAIAGFYNSHGIEAHISRRDDPLARPGSRSLRRGCFASVSRYEIVAEGTKIAAGSQRRTRRALMQHGVIRLAPPEGHPALLETRPVASGELYSNLRGSRRKLEKTFVECVAKTFQVEVDIRPFSIPERACIGKRCERFKNLNTGHLSLNNGRG